MSRRYPMLREEQKLIESETPAEFWAWERVLGRLTHLPVPLDQCPGAGTPRHAQPFVPEGTR